MSVLLGVELVWAGVCVLMGVCVVRGRVEIVGSCCGVRSCGVGVVGVCGGGRVLDLRGKSVAHVEGIPQLALPELRASGYSNPISSSAEWSECGCAWEMGSDRLGSVW